MRRRSLPVCNCARFGHSRIHDCRPSRMWMRWCRRQLPDCGWRSESIRPPRPAGNCEPEHALTLLLVISWPSACPTKWCDSTPADSGQFVSALASAPGRWSARDVTETRMRASVMHARIGRRSPFAVRTIRCRTRFGRRRRGRTHVYIARPASRGVTTSGCGQTDRLPGRRARRPTVGLRPGTPAPRSLGEARRAVPFRRTRSFGVMQERAHDKGKPGESRRRNVTRLPQPTSAIAYHVRRAAERHDPPTPR